MNGNVVVYVKQCETVKMIKGAMKEILTYLDKFIS